MDALPFGGLYQAGDDAVGFKPYFRSCSEAYFAENHYFSQRLLGMIIGRGYAWDAEKRKEVFLLRADKVSSQGLGRLKTKRLFASAFEFSYGKIGDVLNY